MMLARSGKSVVVVVAFVGDGDGMVSLVAW